MTHRKYTVLATGLLAGLLLILACKSNTDTTPPAVVIISPSNGETLGQVSIQIKAYATDNKAMAKVEFYVDNTLMGTDAHTGGLGDTYRFTWDATHESLNTSHTILGTAYDSSNNHASSQAVNVVIAHGGHGGGPTHHGADITASETWYPSGNPQIIDATIDVNNNATLTIMPGCIVQFSSGTELECGYASPGAIIAVGVGKPDSGILFTSEAATPNKGDWEDVGMYDHTMPTTQFEYCTFQYGGGDATYGEVFIRNNKVVKIDHCKIWNSADYGIVFNDVGDMLASFTTDSITTCAKYPVWIHPDEVASIGGGNALTGNTTDGVLIQYGDVTVTSTWANLGVPYVLSGDVQVHAASGPTLTIAPGTTIALQSNAEFYCGYTDPGGIIADGSAGRIVFTSAVASPHAGNWHDVGVYAKAVAATFTNCLFEYGGGDPNYGEFYITDNKVAKIDHCKIWKSADYGVYCNSLISGFASFTYDTITSCALYPIIVYPEWVGAIGAGNVLSGNTTDGVLVIYGDVTATATWGNHGVPYIISGDVQVDDPSGPTLTIAPGTTIKLQSHVEFYCGYNYPGAIVADGSSGQIVFTSALTTPGPGDWKDVGFYDKTGAQTSLTHCKIEYGGYGGSNGDIYIRSTAAPAITQDSIGRSSDWGIYLDGSPLPDSVPLRLTNTFYNNASGDIFRPGP